VKLMANPDMEEKEAPGVATNTSEMALALQRSRYGSNTFGARIDLKEPFSLGTSKKYVHVLVNKPADENANVMLIGLGKRHDWEEQAPETEQFWVTASLSAQGQWNDLVFPITTNESVDIHSFVIVPGLASPHLRTTDFIAFIDDIEVTDSPKPRYQIINYPLNFDTNQTPTRSDRALTKLTFTSTGESSKDVTVPTATIYNNLNAMNELGIIKRLHIDGVADCFDKVMEPHDHLLCDRCGKITDIHLPALADTLENELATEIEDYELTVHYICPECRSNSRRRSATAE
jgi:hypothetical protein